VRFLLIEPFSGASGDMFLGALLDLGVPVADVERTLKTLPIGGWSLSAEKTTRGGIAATKARVRLDALGGGEEGYATAHAHRHAHSHDHDHHHDHGHDHQHGHDRGGHHVHRTAGEIFAIIRASGLPEAVKTKACDVFAALASAEARVHGLTPETVHFHEVGAIDAIIDICGSVLALSMLGSVDHVVATTATTGFGLVRCAHGTVPAPAPATVFLMEGLPVRRGPVEGELLTPTGAALLKTLVNEWAEPGAYVTERTGFGAGNSDWEGLPNVLRMTIAQARAGVTRASILEAEFDVDDMRGEDLGFLREGLQAAGAVDVAFAPIMMKKDRPGHRVTVLFEGAREQAIEDVIFRQSSTYGFRLRTVERRILDREIVEVGTPHGRCRVKIGRHKGEVVQVRPEYEDVAALSRASGRPLPEIEAAVIAAYLNRKPPTART
jgi:uncharacterized protein (TIGR00299 family) protein